MTGGALAHRETDRPELMDDPHCDPVRLERTYRQFAVVNRLLSGWRQLYRSRIRPRLRASRPTTLLDIGFGAGDIPRALAGWARRDGLALQITAIDPDARAIEHVRDRPAAGVRFEQAGSADLVARGERFDLVTSNHLLHHLDADSLGRLLADSEALSRGLVLHNDLERLPLGYGVYAVATLPLRSGSFLHDDGLLSIRRSHRRHEL